MRTREASLDVRLIPWLDSLRADTVFGWRQLMKKKLTSTAAILSLGLAIGACTSAFRLIDAVLLRPLPVSEPERLYALARQAELFAISYAKQTDLTYKSDQEMEKAYLQYVSGTMFGSFGLQPALGRLLTANDDLKPRAHPYAVLSYGYWKRRFGHPGAGRFGRCRGTGSGAAARNLSRL